MRRTLALDSDDAAVRAWRRNEALEADRDSVARWVAVPLRVFIFVTVFGTLLQSEFGGMAWKAALGSAMSVGSALAALVLVRRLL